LKTIKLAVSAPFSDAAIGKSITLLKNENHNLLSLVLVISVFDIDHAVGMMLDDRRFTEIRSVEVSRYLSDGQYNLVDKINDVMVNGSDS